MNPLISPGIVLLGIFRSGFVIFIAAIGLIVLNFIVKNVLRLFWGIMM